VVRLENGQGVALIRTQKAGRDPLYGSAVGGGALVYAGDTVCGENRLHVDRETTRVEGNFTLYPSLRGRLTRGGTGLRAASAGLRQWLFVARLLWAAGRRRTAVRRLWRGYVSGLLRALTGPAGSHWATHVTGEPEDRKAVNEGELTVTSRPARPDGTLPVWSGEVVARRTYRLDCGHVRVDDVVRCEVPRRPVRVGRVEYLVPRKARDLSITSSGAVTGRAAPGEAIVLRPTQPRFWLRVTYAL
jgi:hypothetical protein